jgi:hypothetical protein
VTVSSGRRGSALAVALVLLIVAVGGVSALTSGGGTQPDAVATPATAPAIAEAAAPTAITVSLTTPSIPAPTGVPPQPPTPTPRPSPSATPVPPVVSTVAVAPVPLLATGCAAGDLSSEALVARGAVAMSSFPGGVMAATGSLFQLGPQLFVRGANGCYSAPAAQLIVICVDGAVLFQAVADCGAHAGVLRQIDPRTP